MRYFKLLFFVYARSSLSDTGSIDISSRIVNGAQENFTFETQKVNTSYP